MDFRDQIHDFIVKNFLFEEGAELQDVTSFLEAGIIDSTGILELVTFLEESFDIRVEDDELIPENLDTLANLIHYVERKIYPNETALHSNYGS